MRKKIITINNVAKSYKSTQYLFTLKNISFDITEGEIVSVIGLNGAGKTTIIKLILGIIKPTEGEIITDSHHQFESGYLPENFSVQNLKITVKEFIDFFSNLSYSVNNRKKNDIEEIMNLFDLFSIKDKKVNLLSKGTLKRLGIAQAMIGNPKLIILDEPTDGLDPEWRLKVKQIINTKKKQGISFLISSHLLFELEKLSDRILILHNGLQLYFGPFDSEIVQTDVNRLNVYSNEANRQSLEELFFKIIKPDETN